MPYMYVCVDTGERVQRCDAAPYVRLSVRLSQLLLQRAAGDARLRNTLLSPRDARTRH